MADELPINHTDGLEEAAQGCPLLGGDQEWAACCTRKFHPWARRVAGGDDIALDVLQESWIQIHRAVHKYRGGSPARAWVRVIVENSAKRVHRKSVLSTAVPLAAESMQPEDPRPTAETLL